jgi:CheY-like chemotaxis protein
VDVDRPALSAALRELSRGATRIEARNATAEGRSLVRVTIHTRATKGLLRGPGLVPLVAAHLVVQRHGGSVEQEHDAVVVVLPASEESAAQGAGRPRSILVMDDEENLRLVLRQLLAALGYRVEAAKDGKEAIEKYRAAMEAGSRFDLVIMDLTVPRGMGGIDAIRVLRDVDPQVCAIVSTGQGSDAIDAAAHGFRGVLAKPYMMKDLEESISRALDA